MALHIVFSNGDEFVRHIPLENISVNIESINYIQADGHELDYIISKFYKPETKEHTIPIPNNRVSKWYGDIAKTIIANL